MICVCGGGKSNLVTFAIIIGLAICAGHSSALRVPMSSVLFSCDKFFIQIERLLLD